MDTSSNSIRSYRIASGQTLAELSRLIGASVGHLSSIERGAPVSLPLALKLESLSEGSLDAAALCPAVAAARAGIGRSVKHVDACAPDHTGATGCEAADLTPPAVAA